MPVMNTADYQIFNKGEDLKKYLSDSFSILVTYPGFVIAQSDEKTIAVIKSTYPVRQLKPPSPPPSMTKIADLDQAFSKITRRGPYFVVVKLAAVLPKDWKAKIQSRGMEIVETLGGRTLTLYCANKRQLAWLHKQDFIVSVSWYIPKVQLTHDPAESKGRNTQKIIRQVSKGDLFIAQFFRNQERELSLRSLKRSGIPEIDRIGDDSLLIDLFDHQQPLEALQKIIQRRGLRILKPENDYPCLYRPGAAPDRVESCQFSKQRFGTHRGRRGFQYFRFRPGYRRPQRQPSRFWK